MGVTNNTDYFMYRCLNMGLVGFNLAFTLDDDLEVNISCDDNPYLWMSSAVYLSVTFAAAATFATLFWSDSFS